MATKPTSAASEAAAETVDRVEPAERVLLEPSRRVMVEQTSVSSRNFSENEVTLRFLKWHAHGMTAYQKGQFAGFSVAAAQRLIAQGVAILAESVQQRREVAAHHMITK